MHRGRYRCPEAAVRPVTRRGRCLHWTASNNASRQRCVTRPTGVLFNSSSSFCRSSLGIPLFIRAAGDGGGSSGDAFPASSGSV